MTMRIRAVFVALLAAALPPVLAATPAAAQQSSYTSPQLPSDSDRPVNWLTTVEELDDGAHRMGDPEASLQLTEFVSYTCPHCATFERQSEGALKLMMVQTGEGAITVRHLIRDPIDLTMALLARCGTADRFFTNHTALMYAQDDIFATGRALTEPQIQLWQTPDHAQQRRYIARDLELYQILETRGYTRQELEACVSDNEEAELIFRQSNAAADAAGINSTPSFTLNGQTLAGVHSWAQLSNILQDAASSPAQPAHGAANALQ